MAVGRGSSYVSSRCASGRRWQLAGNGVCVWLVCGPLCGATWYAATALVSFVHSFLFLTPWPHFFRLVWHGGGLAGICRHIRGMVTVSLNLSLPLCETVCRTLYLIVMILTGNVSGLAFGEMEGTCMRTRMWYASGLGILCVAIVVVALGGTS